MLMQRVITSVILLPLVIAAIWYMPTWGIALLYGVMLVIGAWEWAGMAGLKRSWQLLYVLILILMMLALLVWRTAAGLPLTVVILAGMWWFCALVWMLIAPILPKGRSMLVIKLLLGPMILLPSLVALVYLHEQSQIGHLWVLAVCVLVWGADIGAYFAGRTFGKHKLAPKVSPGKTWEGFFGGAAAGAVAGWLMGHLAFGLTDISLAAFTVLSVWVVGFSVVGDLTASRFKRHVDVKDSGRLFPGHGGVLDRLDSLFAAAPVFLAGLLLLGYYA